LASGAAVVWRLFSCAAPAHGHPLAGRAPRRLPLTIARRASILTHEHTRTQTPHHTQDDVAYDDTAAEGAYGVVSTEDEEDFDEDDSDDDFGEPDDGYATATGSLASETAPSLDLDVLEARQAEGKRERAREIARGLRPQAKPDPHSLSSDGDALTHTHSFPLSLSLNLSLSVIQPSRKRSA